MSFFNTVRSWFLPVNTNAYHKYFLSNPSKGQIELTHAPDGWADAGDSFTRSARYSGVFRKYTLSELGFVKEGKAFLEDVEAEQGFEAQVDFIVFEWDPITIQYIEVFRGNIQLVDKDVDELKYTVPVDDSSFENKVLNRDDIEVIVGKKSADDTLKSLDGKVIPGFANEGQLITLPKRIDSFNTDFTSNRVSSYSYGIGGDKDPIIPILFRGSSDYEEGDDTVKTNTNSYLNIAGAFYTNTSGTDAEVSINGIVEFSIQINSFLPLEDVTVKIFIVDNLDQITSEINIPVTKELIASTGGSLPALTYLVKGDLNETFNVPDNHYIQIGVVESSTPVNAAATMQRGVIIDFALRTQSGFSPKINVDSWMEHEGFARILQVITGENNPFISNYFGRKDSEPRVYEINGEGSLRTTTNGGLIRGFPQTNRVAFNEAIAPLSMSLRDKFDANNSLSPIGMGIELVDGVKTVRIEDLKYFYDTRVVITIDDATEVKSEYNKDLIPNQVEFGSSKFESDEIRDGKFDYNTKSGWSNAIQSVQKKESKVSKYSFSNASINEARKKTKESEPTTDSKYDDINYVIDLVENQTPNAILNPSAEQGTANWAVSSGVATEVLIGNPRFVLQQEDGGQTSMTQDLGDFPEPVFSFSYAVLSENELTLTPTFQITATLNDTSKWSLNSNGDWVPGTSEYPATTIQGVKRENFQSMNKFEIAANARLEDINKIEVSFDTAFLSNLPGVNELVIDDVYLSDSAKYKARTTEGFDFINGIVNSNDSYNVLFAPGRALRNHGFILRAPLDDKLNTEYVFSNSDKFSTLVSKKTGESQEVAESTNVLINDLEEPIWGVELFTFEFKISAQQKQDLRSYFEDGKPKIYGLIQWRENENQAYQYGWIQDLNTGGFDEKATIEVIPISKYVNPAETVFAADSDGAIFTDSDGAYFTIKV